MVPFQALEVPAHPPIKEELPEMESIYTNNGIAPEITEAPHPAPPNELRMYLARQNVARKRNLVRNIIAYVIAWIVCFGLMHPAFATVNQIGQTHRTNLVIYEPFAQEIPQLFQFGHNSTEIEFCPYTFGYMLETYIVDNVIEHIDNALESFAVRGWRNQNNSARGRVRSTHIVNDVARTVSESAMANAHFYSVHPAAASQSVAIFANHNNTQYFAVGTMFGIMIAWGVWILARGIQVSRHNMRNMPKKPLKPDPVALEYQRLSREIDH